VTAAALFATPCAVSRVSGDTPPRTLPRWIAGLFAIPLAGKLAGASVIVFMVAFGAALGIQDNAPRNGSILLVMLCALGMSVCVNVGLVLIALRPIRDLEAAAERVSQGDLDARVSPSRLADRDIARIGRTFNRVLDELIADRARMRRLASQVILEGDRQRAAISRELHDSAAQSLAALMLEVAAAKRVTTAPELTARLETIRSYAVDVLDEVRLLAQRVHPRVLDDLGLRVALDRLGRITTERSGVRVDIGADLHGPGMPLGPATVLYRVAEEAIANAVRHGSARTVNVSLVGDDRNVRLAVTDDGRGFEVEGRPVSHPGVGLFTMRQRVALAGGIFEIESRPGAGTVVSAIVPIPAEANPVAG
jgi:signal transduction histidine kinase